MRIRNYVLGAAVALAVLCSSASAAIISEEVTWTQRTEINSLEGGFLEIVEGGHLIAEARLDYAVGERLSSDYDRDSPGDRGP